MTPPDPARPALTRHLGLWQATALNVTLIVGAGVFATVPLMTAHLPGPYAVLGWVAGAALMFADALIWCELAAMYPGSGGSYLYLREGFGRDRVGRLMAFLFIWQFLLSGPLEVASGLVALAQFAASLSPSFRAFNDAYTFAWPPGHAAALTRVTVSPAWLAAVAAGVAILVLLCNRIEHLGRVTVALSLAVLGVIGWILVAGALHFDPAKAFDATPPARPPEGSFTTRLGQAMILALYSYLGYYNVCYVGDEVRDPERTIPRAVLLSALVVTVLFIGTHLAMLGVVSWREVPVGDAEAMRTYSLPAEFMRRVHGEWAVTLVTLLLMASCFGSAFAGLLAYARVPYGAAADGYFFRPFARVHPRLKFPHVALALVGGLTLFWTLFDLENVIKALITTRIVEQFVAQVVAVVLLRLREPDRPRPFRAWLYPVPCGLALAGWLYVYFSAEWFFIALGLVTLAAGAAAFLAWSWAKGDWPFARPGA